MASEQRLTIRPDTTELRTRSDARFEVGTIGVLPDVNPSIRALVAGEPAEKAGLKPGDVIVSINGAADGVRRRRYRRRSPSTRSRTIQMRRAAERRRADDCRRRPRGRARTGRIGINISDEVESFTPSPLQAIGMSVQRNFEMSGMILRTWRDLFSGEASPRQLMGPVGIAQLSGESAQAGWVALFSLMASLSLNLGLLNLLPIPVLDGGHIFIMGIETIVRRDFSLAVKEKMLFAGFVALMALMVTVIYNDLTRISWIENLMFWR